MARPNRQAVLLAVGASGGVIAAEVFGVLNAGLGVAVMVAAGAFAALSLRSSHSYAEPHAAAPLLEWGGTAVIAAPRASELAQAQQQTDAA